MSPKPNTPTLLVMNEISFIDTTLRDGQQNLWALGMKTDAMLGAAAQMDRIGFESMEFFVSIMIKKYVRELKENPWTWVCEGVKRIRQTRLRNHGGLHGSGAMEKLPPSAMKVLAERLVCYGITLPVRRGESTLLMSGQNGPQNFSAQSNVRFRLRSGCTPHLYTKHKKR